MLSASNDAIMARSDRNCDVFFCAQVNPRQPRNPLGAERIVLAGQLVELLGFVEPAGLHHQLAQQVDHAFVRVIRVERRLEDLERGVIIADRDQELGLHVAGQRVVRLELECLLGKRAAPPSGRGVPSARRPSGHSSPGRRASL